MPEAMHTDTGGACTRWKHTVAVAAAAAVNPRLDWELDPTKCKAVCGQELVCGHVCTSQCGQCFSKSLVSPRALAGGGETMQGGRQVDGGALVAEWWAGEGGRRFPEEAGGWRGYSEVGGTLCREKRFGQGGVELGVAV